MTGKQEFAMAWRDERIASSACLRSVHLYAELQQFPGSLKPVYGGPPD